MEEVEPVPTTAPLYSMRQRRMLRHNGSVVTFDWSPDKRHLMTVCRNPNSIIWDAFGAQKVLKSMNITFHFTMILIGLIELMVHNS